MKGHEPLISMRMKGSVPSCVWIDTDEDKLGAWKTWTYTDKQGRSIPYADNLKESVQIEPSDKRPDMRYVVGLPCYIFGSDSKSVFAVRDACIEAKASRVIATVMQRFGKGEFVAFRTVEVTDTAGHMTMKPSTSESAYG